MFEFISKPSEAFSSNTPTPVESVNSVESISRDITVTSFCFHFSCSIANEIHVFQAVQINIIRFV